MSKNKSKKFPKKLNQEERKKKILHRNILISAISVVAVTSIVVLIVALCQNYVTFDDGYSMADITTIRVKNGTVTPPTNPTRKEETLGGQTRGYIFNGWYGEQGVFSESGFVDFSTAKFTDSVVLAASWSDFFYDDMAKNYYDRQAALLLSGNTYDRGFVEKFVETNKELTNKDLITYVTNDIRQNSIARCYQLNLSYEYYVGSSVIEQLTYVIYDQKVYVSENKEYYKSGTNYINVLDSTDVITDVTGFTERTRTDEYYLNKSKTKVYIKETTDTEEILVNVVDSSDVLNIAQLNIMDQVTDYGQVAYIGTNVYINYDPKTMGYNSSENISLAFNYFMGTLFNQGKAFPSYLVRFMIEVYYNLNADEVRYEPTRQAELETEVITLFERVVTLQEYIKKYDTSGGNNV